MQNCERHSTICFCLAFLRDHRKQSDRKMNAFRLLLIGDSDLDSSAEQKLQESNNCDTEGFSPEVVKNEATKESDACTHSYQLTVTAKGGDPPILRGNENLEEVTRKAYSTNQDFRKPPTGCLSKEEALQSLSEKEQKEENNQRNEHVSTLPSPSPLPVLPFPGHSNSPHHLPSLPLSLPITDKGNIRASVPPLFYADAPQHVSHASHSSSTTMGDSMPSESLGDRIPIPPHSTASSYVSEKVPKMTDKEGFSSSKVMKKNTWRILPQENNTRTCITSFDDENTSAEKVGPQAEMTDMEQETQSGIHSFVSPPMASYAQKNSESDRRGSMTSAVEDATTLHTDHPSNWLSISLPPIVSSGVTSPPTGAALPPALRNTKNTLYDWCCCLHSGGVKESPVVTPPPLSSHKKMASKPFSSAGEADPSVHEDNKHRISTSSRTTCISAVPSLECSASLEGYRLGVLSQEGHPFASSVDSTGHALADSFFDGGRGGEVRDMCEGVPRIQRIPVLPFGEEGKEEVVVADEAEANQNISPSSFNRSPYTVDCSADSGVDPPISSSSIDSRKETERIWNEPWRANNFSNFPLLSSLLQKSSFSSKSGPFSSLGNSDDLSSPHSSRSPCTRDAASLRPEKSLSEKWSGKNTSVGYPEKGRNGGFDAEKTPKKKTVKKNRMRFSPIHAVYTRCSHGKPHPELLGSSQSSEFFPRRYLLPYRSNYLQDEDIEAAHSASPCRCSLHRFCIPSARSKERYEDPFISFDSFLDSTEASLFHHEESLSCHQNHSYHKGNVATPHATSGSSFCVNGVNVHPSVYGDGIRISSHSGMERRRKGRRALSSRYAGDVRFLAVNGLSATAPFTPSQGDQRNCQRQKNSSAWMERKNVSCTSSAYCSSKRWSSSDLRGVTQMLDTIRSESGSGKHDRRGDWEANKIAPSQSLSSFHSLFSHFIRTTCSLSSASSTNYVFSLLCERGLPHGCSARENKLHRNKNRENISKDNYERRSNSFLSIPWSSLVGHSIFSSRANKKERNRKEDAGISRSCGRDISVSPSSSFSPFEAIEHPFDDELLFSGFDTLKNAKQKLPRDRCSAPLPQRGGKYLKPCPPLLPKSCSLANGHCASYRVYPSSSSNIMISMLEESCSTDWDGSIKNKIRCYSCARMQSLTQSPFACVAKWPRIVQEDKIE